MPVSFNHATSGDFRKHIEDQIVRTWAVSKKSQRQIGKELGVAASGINQLVHLSTSGKRDFPSLSTLLKWAEVTGHKLVLYFEKEDSP